MSAYERAVAAMVSLEALADERRETIALAILAAIDAHTGAPLSSDEFSAVDARLREEGHVGSAEDIESVFRTLLRAP
jgi:hypothetical protein